MPQTRMKPRADEGTRTLDTWLGKPVLYQLSYVRAPRILAPPDRPSLGSFSGPSSPFLATRFSDYADGRSVCGRLDTCDESDVRDSLRAPNGVDAALEQPAGGCHRLRAHVRVEQ
jgi:hypothetical protein